MCGRAVEGQSHSLCFRRTRHPVFHLAMDNRRPLQANYTVHPVSSAHLHSNHPVPWANTVPDLSDTTTISTATMTTKTTMTSQLHGFPHQVNPWIPYQLYAQGIEQLERGFNFPLGCNATCPAKTIRCSEVEVPRCFDMDCHCSKGFLLPNEFQTSVSTHGRIAVVLAGQTRSFFSELMNEYWRLFLAQFHGDAVLFAVLSTVSGQKGRYSGLPSRRKDQVWSKFTVRELQKCLDKLNVTWDAVFLDDPCSWEVARKYVKDRILRDMLTPSKPGKLPGEGGYENVFRARTIAFDRLLQYEKETGRRFQHVIVLRPDIVTYFGNEDPVSVVRSVKDTVLWFNDMVSIFERKFATYVFTVPATLRTLHSSATDPDAFLALHHRLWNRSNTASRIIILHGHLGYHGIPVCGRQLQALPIIRCNFPDLEVLMIGIVRDLWRVKGPQRLCLDLIRGSLKLLQEEFRRLGVRESLVENFIVCHKDMWRHVVRPGSWHRSNRANAESTSCLERKVVFWLGLLHISLDISNEMCSSPSQNTTL